jgi:hypothetical protein
VLAIVSLASACSILPLAPVQSPPAVSRRQRPPDDYNDRLVDALAGVLGRPALPSSERLIAAASPKVELLLLMAAVASD